MSSVRNVDIEIKQKKIRIQITLVLGLCLSIICGMSLLYIFSSRGVGKIDFRASNKCTVIEQPGSTISNHPYESVKIIYSDPRDIVVEYHPGKLVPSKCDNFSFMLSSAPSNLVIVLNGYNPKEQEQQNSLSEKMGDYLTIDKWGNHRLNIPKEQLQSFLTQPFFENTETRGSPFTFVFEFENVVQEPTFSRRAMFGVIDANNPTFENISIELPAGARPLPFSPVSHWTPSGFRQSNPKYWKSFDEFAISSNDKLTNISVAYDFPDKERLERTLILILSTLFGVGISAMIEAFLSLGTASIVGVLVREQQNVDGSEECLIHERDNKK